MRKYIKCEMLDYISIVGILLLIKQKDAIDIENIQACFEQNRRDVIHTGMHTNSTCICYTIAFLMLKLM
jgi:hypothetical protein